MPTSPKPVVLVILDGWGYSENPKHNAIQAANTPFWDYLWQHYPHTLIEASGEAVGLPKGQMGNSEVGHVHLGAGRLVPQDITRIDQAISSGEFFTNPVLTASLNRSIKTDQAVHIMGLLSDGGVHSHDRHLQAMVKMAAKQGAKQIYLHAFTDGRDTAPRSALDAIARMEKVFEEVGQGRFASLIGRYFAMDRDHRWDRTQAAYKLLFHGQAKHRYPDAQSAIEAAYARGQSDEFIDPTLIVPNKTDPVQISNQEALFFMNFRADRARQLAQAIADPSFQQFDREHPATSAQLLSLTELDKTLDIPKAFPLQALDNVMGQYIAQQGLRQLRVAETEKYAHVTFFYNGGIEQAFAGEQRILVPSPNVATYDLKPEMSAAQVTDHLVDAIQQCQHDFIVCNYANTDMVGHTGNQQATEIAVQTIDGCLKRLCNALLATGGEMLITADHGNAESLFNASTQQAHTAHTTNPVPLIYIGKRPITLSHQGVLSDIAPTLLAMMGLEQPVAMTGRSLITPKNG